MDELVEGIFTLMFGLLVAAVAVGIFALLLSIGGVYGAAVAVYNYFKALKTNVKRESFAPSSAPAASLAEPTIRSYFFGKGYRDLKATIRDSLDANKEFAENIWKQAAAASFFLLRAVHYGAALSCVIYGTLFFGLLSVVHIILLGVCSVVAYTLFTLVFLAEKAYLALRGFLTVCPACHVQTPLPIYLCDRCGSEHRNLLPSSYGIFHHRCKCEQQLPATFFLNRGRLAAKCTNPNCGHFLSRAHTEARKQFVPIIGGPSTGKTAYLVWLVDELKRWAASAGQDLAFLNPPEAATFDTRLADLRHGHMPDKTVATTPSAINVTFSRRGHLDRNLYVYDAAGEAYLAEQELTSHRFLGYCSGVLLLIDPFSIPAVQRQYGIDPSRESDLKPSLQRPDDLIDRLLFVLEKHFGVEPSTAVKVPIAIVLTKVDAFNLEATVGDGALPPSLGEAEREAARNKLISRKLREWDMTPLIEAIETRFEKKCYFSCSAVGLARNPDGGFAPERIALPFLWLMDQAKRVLRRRRARLAYAAVAAGILLAGTAFAAKIHLDDETLYSEAGRSVRGLQGYLDTCKICWRAEMARTAIATIEQEEKIYRAARGDLQRLRTYVNTCKVCAFKSVAQDEIRPLERKELAEQEQRTYNSARGHLASLRNYVNSCQVCAFKAVAQNEIQRLERVELAAQEARTYSSARGTLYLLRAYVSNCQVCAFKSAAESEVEELNRKETADQERRTYDAARGDIDRLTAYVRDCRNCEFEPAARNEIGELERLAEEEEQRRNPTVTFQIKSNHPNTVALSFHSSIDRSRAWPGGNQVYVLKDWETHRYRLSCQPGENICYGAWVDGGPLSPYWGAGYMGRESCRNCCFTCPTGETAPIVLDPRDAKQPTPSITWRVQSDYPYTVDVAFYSSTRYGHHWPGGGQVWVINNSSVQTYKLTCTAGENICYGAWPQGNPTRYWGVGYGGNQACTNCCYICDGSETKVIVLNP